MDISAASSQPTCRNWELKSGIPRCSAAGCMPTLPQPRRPLPTRPSGMQRDKRTGREASYKTTTIPYREVLRRLWILDPIPAWAPTNNRLARLNGAPKHQLVDPALSERLTGVNAQAFLRGGGPRTIPRDSTFLGALFESLTALSVRVYAQAATAKTSHCRTKGGKHEVDLIVHTPDGRVLAIEVKLSASVEDADVRRLHWLRERLGDDCADAILITTGRYAYRRPDGIGVVPLALLGP